MPTSYLALDVGVARIGLALANDVARIASPLPALNHDDQLWETLEAVVAEHDVQQLVVGWPRGLDGQETDQTRYVQAFMAELAEHLPLPVKPQDEALTSVHAEAELQQRRGGYEKADIDSLSAVYILEDFLAEGVH